MTCMELHRRIMRIIRMHKDGLLTDWDMSDMIAFTIAEFATAEDAQNN